MPIEGLGDCGICDKPIRQGEPIRHFKGHSLAHQGCMETWSQDDQRLARARETRDRLTAQIGAMQADLDAANKVIAELEPKVATATSSNTN
jgi:hypothetical protein